MQFSVSSWIETRHDGERAQDLEQQKPPPVDEEAEVVASCGQDCIGGIADAAGEAVTTRPVFRFEMAGECRLNPILPPGMNSLHTNPTSKSCGEFTRLIDFGRFQPHQKPDFA